MKSLTLGDIRKAVMKMKKINALKKEVKFWKMPVKNHELFEKFRKAGKIKQIRPNGPWDLV